jgi:hypothetical protein
MNWGNWKAYASRLFFFSPVRQSGFDKQITSITKSFSFLVTKWKHNLFSYLSKCQSIQSNKHQIQINIEIYLIPWMIAKKGVEGRMKNTNCEKIIFQRMYGFLEAIWDKCFNWELSMEYIWIKVWCGMERTVYVNPSLRDNEQQHR